MQLVRLTLLVAVAAVLLVLAGCGSDPDPAVDPVPAPSPTETTVPPTSPSATPTSGPVAQAVADLAGSLGVDEADVEVVSIEEVTWRDGSRGCARPGTSYTQALVDGSRIIMRVGKTTYEYHSGGLRPASRCEKPTE